MNDSFLVEKQPAFDCEVVIYRCEHGVPIMQKCPDCPPRVVAVGFYFDGDGKFVRPIHRYNDGTEIEYPKGAAE